MINGLDNEKGERTRIYIIAFSESVFSESESKIIIQLVKEKPQENMIVLCLKAYNLYLQSSDF